MVVGIYLHAVKLDPFKVYRFWGYVLRFAQGARNDTRGFPRRLCFQKRVTGRSYGGDGGDGVRFPVLVLVDHDCFLHILTIVMPFLANIRK